VFGQSFLRPPSPPPVAQRQRLWRDSTHVDSRHMSLHCSVTHVTMCTSVDGSDPRSSVFLPLEPDRGCSASKVRLLRRKCFVVLLAVLMSAFLAITTSLGFMFRPTPFVERVSTRPSSSTIKGFQVVRPPLIEPATPPTTFGQLVVLRATTRNTSITARAAVAAAVAAVAAVAAAAAVPAARVCA
jgi:hypothetical protein